jgi:hypothetical protein
MAVLGVGMMPGVVARCLDKAGTLKKGNEASIFKWCSMRPFMNLVSIYAEDYDQPDMPGEHSQQPGNCQHQQSNTQE